MLPLKMEAVRGTQPGGGGERRVFHKALSAHSKRSGQRVERKKSRRKIFLPAGGGSRGGGRGGQSSHVLRPLHTTPPVGSGFFFFSFLFFPTSSSHLGGFQSRVKETGQVRREGGKEKSNKMKQNESKSRSGISNSFHRPQRQGAGSQIWLLRLKVTPHPSQPAPLPAGPALSNQNIQTEVGGRVPESAPKRRRETPQIPPPIPQPGAPGCSFFFFFLFLLNRKYIIKFTKTIYSFNYKPGGGVGQSSL